MKLRLPLSALAASILLGCAGVESGDQVWYKENGTTAERDRLLAAARVQARQAHSPILPETAASSGAQERDARLTVINYMTANGWRLVPRDQARPMRDRPRSNKAPRSYRGSAALDH